jgi:hypothetical protein
MFLFTPAPHILRRNAGPFFKNWFYLDSGLLRVLIAEPMKTVGMLIYSLSKKFEILGCMMGAQQQGLLSPPPVSLLKALPLV